MGSKRDESLLPENIRERRQYVTLESTAPKNAQSTYSATTFDSLGFDNSFDLEEFKNNFKIEVLKHTSDQIVFDMVGVDAPIANALRRIMIAEIPTMAIEKVYIQTNTSIIPDEILSHRLGLVPIFADPDAFEFVGEDGEATFANTLVFRLEVDCTKNRGVPDDAPESLRYNNSTVYSRDLIWIPQGDQSVDFASNPVRPVLPDIIIAKLRPGQSIKLEAHVQKGLGRTHAKWSAVCTASYRLLPAIRFKETFTREQALQLKNLCPMNVFDIEDLNRVVVARPRDCTMCRECVREPEWEAKVHLAKKRDHFIFSVESTGIIPPEKIVTKSIEVLMDKCSTFKSALKTLQDDLAKANDPLAADKVDDDMHDDAEVNDDDDAMGDD